MSEPRTDSRMDRGPVDPSHSAPSNLDALHQAMSTLGYLRRVNQDGQWIVKLRCPGCGTSGEIDDDQLHGKVSVDCPNCSFHETRDWWRSALTTPHDFWPWRVKAGDPDA